jgi:hypothetical protein
MLVPPPEFVPPSELADVPEFAAPLPLLPLPPPFSLPCPPSPLDRSSTTAPPQAAAKHAIPPTSAHLFMLIASKTTWVRVPRSDHPIDSIVSSTAG